MLTKADLSGFKGVVLVNYAMRRLNGIYTYTLCHLHDNPHQRPSLRVYIVQEHIMSHDDLHKARE